MTTAAQKVFAITDLVKEIGKHKKEMDKKLLCKSYIEDIVIKDLPKYFLDILKIDNIVDEVFDNLSIVTGNKYKDSFTIDELKSAVIKDPIDTPYFIQEKDIEELDSRKVGTGPLLKYLTK